MKCPKCGYLGFETGDRCKNCGYDFSLIAAPSTPAPDPQFTPTRSADTETPQEIWLDRLDRSMEEASQPASEDHLVGVPEAPERTSTETPDSLPLFNPDDPDDIPLIALPIAPRAPLSVRRPAEPARLRAVPKVARGPAHSAVLDFRPEAELAARADDREEPLPGNWRPAQQNATHDTRHAEASAGRRITAAVIDVVILTAIHIGVLYFTLRMAGLTWAELPLVPVLPMTAFLALLTFAYFAAFTAVGGQTIGKMALEIRVVADNGSMDSARAARRTLAVLLSLLPAGLGFIPMLFGADRRALHDRLAGTRVVRLPSA